MDFILASNNAHKLEEIKRILLPLGINVIGAKEAGVDLADIKETGKTFEENARIKAKAFVEHTNMPSIGDDSGLMVDALNGEPGIYSARYAGEGAPAGKATEKVLNKLKNVDNEDRTATFVTAICCLFPDGREIVVHGECHGKVGYKPIGENGFGYDPIFITEDGRTFAQLTPEEKDKISHRGNALRKLKKALENIS